MEQTQNTHKQSTHNKIPHTGGYQHWGGHNQQREGERIMVEWSDIYGVHGDENERIRVNNNVAGMERGSKEEM